MTPEQLARDAIRVVDRVENTVLEKLNVYLREIERDAKRRLALLDLTDTSLPRAIRELRAREALAGSEASRRLLALGTNAGPLSGEFRSGIAESYRDGVRSARGAIAQAQGITAAEVAAITGMTTRVELDLLEALTRTTLTTLRKVGRDAHDRLELALVRGAVRGAGPRATGRLVRESVNLTRYEAERIARTVFMRANNDARFRSYEEAGVEYVQHNATNDARTCKYCAARHGMVYRRRDRPDAVLHPNCRCVLTPWREDMSNRGDDFYVESRRELAEGLDSRTTATATAPFERMDGREPPKPVWAPGRGYL